MSTITQEQQQKIADWLASHDLPSGLGDEHAACSIAAINLSLYGRLEDKIPDCMSEVVGRWIIGVQDAMPHDMRNSAAWKRLLPLAAGTGRKREKERLEIVMTWVWGTVLPMLSPIAEKYGFAAEWREMLKARTELVADAADAAAVARAAAYAAADAAAAAYAAHAVRAAADAVRANFWAAVDPCGMLAKLIEVSNG